MKKTSRRKFIAASATITAGAVLTPGKTWASVNLSSTEEELYLVGPKEGYTPHIGTMLSMMTMMRHWVINSVKDLTVEELDFQIDDTSNSIGAMLYHLAATERFYQLQTFDKRSMDEIEALFNEDWGIPMSLGKPAREAIKGHEVSFYLEKLESVRKETKKKFAELDDDWLMSSEPFFENKATNNYAKWFHVCEHESNHNGQIKFIKGRLPEKG